MGKKKKKRSSFKDKRWMHTFQISEIQEVQEKEESTNDDGEDVTITRTVEKEIPINFKLKRPTRKLIDDADLHYSVKLSEGIKAGLLTRNLIARRYDDDGGLFNEFDKKEYVETYNKLMEKENEYHGVNLDLGKKTSKKKKSIKSQEIMLEIVELRKQIMNFEQQQQAVFENTAENRARNSTILWWVLHLAYILREQDENPVPVFTGDSYEEKLSNYDLMEEEYDEFKAEYIKKLAFLVSFWYTGRLSSEDDFVQAERMYNEDVEEWVNDEEEEVGEDDPAVKLHTEKVEEEIKEKREELENKKKRIETADKMKSDSIKEKHLAEQKSKEKKIEPKKTEPKKEESAEEK